MLDKWRIAYIVKNGCSVSIPCCGHESIEIVDGVGVETYILDARHGGHVLLLSLADLEDGASYTRAE
jgi:hypothetical protein